MAEFNFNQNDVFGGIKFYEKEKSNDDNLCNTSNETKCSVSGESTSHTSNGTKWSTSGEPTSHTSNGTSWTTSGESASHTSNGTSCSTSEESTSHTSNGITWSTSGNTSSHSSSEKICNSTKNASSNKTGNICGSFFETTNTDYYVKNTNNIFTTQEPTSTYKTIEKNKAITKQGLWSKIRAFLFQEIDLTAPIKVELTPYQQKIEDEINDFLHQEVSFKAIAKLFK